MADVDKLWASAQDHLKKAQETLNQLLNLLQAKHTHVESAPIADCVKATANSFDTMNKLATKWREKAQKESRDPEAFDARPYVKDKLHFERPKSLQELAKQTTFEFDKFLPGDDE